MANISLTLYTNGFIGSVLMSPIQMGSLRVNNSVTNISRLGTFKVKSVSFLLITSDYGDIWQKTYKIENKTQPSLCLQTWLQQNLWISTNHKYRIYMFFATGCFEDLTFCKPDVV
jgi:hypothetical protein